MKKSKPKKPLKSPAKKPCVKRVEEELEEVISFKYRLPKPDDDRVECTSPVCYMPEIEN